MTSPSFMDAMTATAYCLATCLINNVIDDPAMLAIIFC